MHLYKTLVTLYTAGKDVVTIERAQKRLTRMLPGMKGCDEWEKLDIQGLLLEFRRLGVTI